MLCSRCNVRVRPVVAFDIDGVLGDYHGHIHKFAAGYLGDEHLEDRLNQYDGQEPHGEWFEKNGIDRATFRAIKLAYRQGSMKRTMPPFKGNIALTEWAQNQGVEVWLTTTRPYLRLDNIDPDTRWWVDKHGVSFDYMLYDESKYQELSTRVERKRVIAVIDDDFEMYSDAECVFGIHVPILNKIPANRGIVKYQSCFYASSAAELKLMLLSRLQSYERNYG